MNKVLLFVSIILIGFTSCKKEEIDGEKKEPTSKPTPEPTPTEDVGVASSKINVINGNKESVVITKGSGSYEVKSSDELIATVVLKEEKVEVSAVKVGKATITVTDTKTNKMVTFEVNVTPNAEELEVAENFRILELMKSYNQWNDNMFFSKPTTNEFSIAGNTLTMKTTNYKENIEIRKKYTLKNPAISNGKINTSECETTDFIKGTPPNKIVEDKELEFTFTEDKKAPYFGHKLIMNNIFGESITLGRF